MLNKRAIFILFLFFIAFGTISSLSAENIEGDGNAGEIGIGDDTEISEGAPYSELQIASEESSDNGDLSDLKDFDGDELSHNDMEFDSPPVSLINSSRSDSQAIPSSYDSRDYGYISPIGVDDGRTMSWAFAALITLDASIKKATGIDYDFSKVSENDLVTSFATIGFNVNASMGGHDALIQAYLNSWAGPIDPEGYSQSSLMYPKFHIQDIMFLPARQNAQDNDAFKRAIMDYGAVYAVALWLPLTYHGVSLIGWDDNYNDYDSVGNYAKGAWIIKNSWGEDWADHGFGYLSYDVVFGSDNGAFHSYTFIFNEDDSYIYNYQYDNGGLSNYLLSDSHIFYKNTFTANSDSEDLSAFATYFKFPTNYTVSVYVNDNFMFNQSGFSDAGYYTIPLKEKIPLSKGDEFTIMVENANEGLNLLAVCQEDLFYEVDFEEGLSFVSFDGENWTDLYNLTGNYEFWYSGYLSNTSQVACLKAFTSLKELLPAEIHLDKFDDPNVNEKFTVNVSGAMQNGTLVTISINGKYYYAMVSDNRACLNMSIDKAGTYALTAQYKNNIYESNVVQFNFTVNRKNTSLHVGDVSKVYGGSEHLLVTLKDDKGNGIRDAIIVVSINGNSIKIKTDSEGQAAMPIDMAPGTYHAAIVFEGDGEYASSGAASTLIVKKATPKLTAYKKTFKVKTKTKKYAVTLKDNYGRPIKGVQVTLKIKKKTYKATVDAKGKATFKVKLNKKGKYRASVKFSGNAYYNAVGKNIIITVKK